MGFIEKYVKGVLGGLTEEWNYNEEKFGTIEVTIRRIGKR